MKKRFSIITFFLKKLHYKTPLLIYMVLYACKLYYLYLLICTLHHSVLIHSFIFQSQILLRQLNQNPCLEIHWVIIKSKFHKIFEYTPYRWSIFINSIGYATRQKLTDDPFIHIYGIYHHVKMLTYPVYSLKIPVQKHMQVKYAPIKGKKPKISYLLKYVNFRRKFKGMQKWSTASFLPVLQME